MAATPPVLTWRGEDIYVGALEHHLDDLWKQVALDSADIHPVRTHVFNLIVYTRDEEEAAAIGANLDSLSHYQPSRTILLMADRMQPNSSVDAQLSIGCSRPSEGSARCHERAFLTVRGRAADHLASVVTPLLLTELPTYLWWPGQPLFGHRLFHRLLAAADQLVVDSAQFDSPGDGLAHLANLCMGRHGVNDFNWARLTPWREIVAQFFDGPRFAQYLSGIRSISLEFGAGSSKESDTTASVLLLLGWMASRLDWEPETTLDRPPTGDTTLAVLQKERLIPIELLVREHGKDAAGRLMSLEICASITDQPTATFRLQRSAELAHVQVTTRIGEENEVSRVVPVASGSAAQMLADELALAGKDILYDEVVRAASRLAGREVWRPM